MLGLPPRGKKKYLTIFKVNLIIRLIIYENLRLNR